MRRNTSRTAARCFAFSTVLVAASILCATSALATRNIIVFMADDLDWVDLPFFNPPVQWATPNNPTASGQPRRDEAELRSPELNRLAARLFADRSTGHLGTYSVDGDYPVVPVDLDFGIPAEGGSVSQLGGVWIGTGTDRNVDGAAPYRFAYTQTSGCSTLTPNLNTCNPATDILANHGGLAEIARRGAVFRRFYSTAARCSPARASFITGLYERKAGVVDVSDTQLPSERVTIAEFLKQGCTEPSERLCINPDWNRDTENEYPLEQCPCYLKEGGQCIATATPEKACYTTGLIGKWHLGTKSDQGTMPWQRGFDETVIFAGPWRGFFTTGDLVCSPDTRTYNPTSFAPCTCPDTEPECSTCKPGFALGDPNGMYLGASSTTSGNVCAGEAGQKSRQCCQETEYAELKGGRFNFKDKNNGDYANDIHYIKETDDKWQCADDDAPTDTTGCLYYTRVIRDHAKNFIERHQDEPFFLVVPFTATHLPHQAPKRTERHYMNPKPTNKTPQQFRTDIYDSARPPNTRYWAMIEEMDAAIGAVIDKLASLEILDDTYIFFTSDHGKGRDFGIPNLNGGKGSVWEGGVRMGMLAMGPGINMQCSNDASPCESNSDCCENNSPECTDATCVLGTSPILIGDDDIGSLVDMFPTIAEAAGYPVAGGRLTLDACAKTGKPCGGTDGACETGDVCGLPLEGKSLLPYLKGGATHPRGYVFANFHSDTAAVITRQGHILEDECEGNSNCSHAAKVCGVDATGYCSTTTTKLCNDNVDCPSLPSQETCIQQPRQVRAASCVSCQSAGDCNAPCFVLGKVCATDTQKGWCDPTLSSRSPTECAKEITKMPRCSNGNDCAQGLKCIDAEVSCQSCVEAAWKLKLANTELYDLATNPEEDPRKLSNVARLDCSRDSCSPGDTNCLRLKSTTEHLSGLLTKWDACQSEEQGACNHKNCELEADTLSPCGG